MTPAFNGLIKIVCFAETLRRGERVTWRCKGRGDRGKASYNARNKYIDEKLCATQWIGFEKIYITSRFLFENFIANDWMQRT